MLEDMSFVDYLTAESDLKERQRKERMKQAEFEKYAKEHNLFVCTTNIIEQIRAEIEQNMERSIGYYDANTPLSERPYVKLERNNARQECLQIIEKYTGADK